MVPLTILPLTAEALPACAKIAAAAPDPWSLGDLQRVLMDENHRSFAAWQAGEMVGFASFLVLADTADLEMVAVAPDQRRRGVAKQLLSHALSQLQNSGVRRVLLELRASNAGAMALYRQLGFAPLSRRPGMYAHPREDGMLMALQWDTNN